MEDVREMHGWMGFRTGLDAVAMEKKKKKIL
jgi:hypothetical protein